MKHKVWNPAEREVLIKAGAAWLFSHPGKTILRSLHEAQKQVLPVDRHRRVASITTVKWFKDGVLALQDKPPKPDVLVKVVERIIPPEVKDFATDVLLTELVKRLLLPHIERIVLRELPAALSAEMHRQKKEPVKEERVRLPRIVIANLLPEQARVVEKEFDGVFDIRVHTESNPATLRQSAVGADMVVLMTKFISHKHQDVVRDLKPFFVNGGVSDLNEFLYSKM